MGIREKLDAEITAQDEDCYFYERDIKNPFWNEGFIVEVDGCWYYSPHDCESHHRLPPFIKRKEDAEAFIRAANEWYVEGHKDGKQKAKSELKSWLNT